MRRRYDDALDRELQFHVDSLVDDLIASGVAPDEARRRARLEFGGVMQTREACRDRRLSWIVRGWWQDIRLAARSLRATPVVAIVAILSLSLGIGANTAIFSIVDSLLLRPLPVDDPSRLVLVTDGATGHVRVWSHPVWVQIRQRPGLFARSAAWSFTARDGAVAVISHGFWQRRFGGAPDVIGRSLRLADVPFTIVGVSPREFFGPDVGRSVDVMLPIADEPIVRGRDSVLQTESTFLTIAGRLKPNQSIEAAQAGLDAVRPQIRAATAGDVSSFSSREGYLRYLGVPFALVPGATGFSVIREDYQRPLMTLLAVVALLLLIACVNIANLLAARAIAKRPELSLRLALGAPRWRLVRQLLTESALLYALAAAGGLALAAWSSRLLVSQIASPQDNVFLDLSLDARVLLFTAAISVVTTLVFGTVPAFRSSRTAAATRALHHNGRVIGGRAVASEALIALQVALSLVLIAGAGLFARTFSSLSGRQFGFDADRVLVVTMDAHRTANDSATRLALYERARTAALGVPGAAEAALSFTTPVANGQFTPRTAMDGTVMPPPVWANLISPGWFATYGTPLVSGRDVSETDRAGAPRVAVVNEAFVRKFLGGGNAIGRTFSLYPGTPREIGPITIVGVARDAVYGSLRAAAPPTYYLPIAQFDHLPQLGIRTMNLSVRALPAVAPGAKGGAAGSSAVLTRGLTDAIASVDPQLSLTFRPLAGQIHASLARERIVALLASVFGGLALLLAAIGLYGVTAYAVARRRTEIGVRMALGADAAAIERLVLTRVSAIVAVGIVGGVVLSAWASKFVASLLYDVAPRDPATLAGAALTLAIISACAGWLPAWRASRIDPAEILRRT